MAKYRPTGRFGIPRWIVICGLVAVAGAILCVIGVLWITGIDERIADYPGVDAGAAEVVELDEGRVYVGYYESTGFGPDGYERSDAPTLEVAGPDGDEVAVDVYASDDTATAQYKPKGYLNYAHGEYRGGPAYSFDTGAGGGYRVEVGASAEPNARILIGPGIVTRKILGFVMAVAGFVIGAIALLIVLAWGALHLLFTRRNG